jgi:SH3-like domain-containing protein
MRLQDGRNSRRIRTPRAAHALVSAVGAALAAAVLALPAAALEFRSTTEPATILYDGPSLKSQKVFVVGRDYPFEVVVALEGWAKVRDMSGSLVWVERKALSDRRIVVVKSGTADVLAAAEANAKPVFRVEQNVLLELVEQPVSGWVKVRHRDGQTGYIAINQVWGL